MGQNIAEVFRRERLKRGLSQVALARLMGVTQSYISGIETGRWDVGIAPLIKMGKVLGFEVEITCKPKGG